MKIETLKREYIDKALDATGLPFRIFTDTGDFQKAVRQFNAVEEYINGIFTLTESSMEYAGDQQIVSITTSLQFLIRLDDDADENGEFPSVAEFREALRSAFAQIPPKFNVTEDGKTYTVVGMYQLPSSGVRMQRNSTGDSFTFSMSVYFTYLSNSINASDVKITIDGEAVNFLAVGFSRRPSIAANLFSESANGESAAYAENAGFVIDLTLPAFVSRMGGIVADYILGITDVNEPHSVTVTFGDKSIERDMIFGESGAQGQGLENIRYTISLIPYASEAVTGG